jgi:hypothetical protein
VESPLNCRAAILLGGDSKPAQPIFAPMKLKTIAALLLVAVGIAGRLEGQAVDQYAFGIAGGAAIPNGQLRDVTGTGASGAVMVAMGNIGSSFGVRFDAMYNWLPGRDTPADSLTATGDVRIIGLTGNLVFSLIGVERRLYAITGIGGYGYRPSASGTKKADDFGWNAGLGIWLPAIGGFVEARYHTFYRALPDPVTGATGKRSARFIPVTIGFLW